MTVLRAGETEAQRPQPGLERRQRGARPKSWGLRLAFTKVQKQSSALWKFLFLHRYILLFEYLLCFL